MQALFLIRDSHRKKGEINRESDKDSDGRCCSFGPLFLRFDLLLDLVEGPSSSFPSSCFFSSSSSLLTAILRLGWFVFVWIDFDRVEDWVIFRIDML